VAEELRSRRLVKALHSELPGAGYYPARTHGTPEFKAARREMGLPTEDRAFDEETARLRGEVWDFTATHEGRGRS
jgi:hypothetical protein